MNNQYKVLKPMINAPVGTILTTLHLCGGLYREDKLPEDGGMAVLNSITDAIAQKFIEPYTTEPKHWRAEENETYFWVDELAWIRRSVEGSNDTDDDKYESGNYFKSQATAELVAKAQKLGLICLHTIPGTPQQNIKNEFEKAQAEARKAVLEDDSNE